MSKTLVNCVILPVGSRHLLIPNTAVASMISYAEPAPLPESPSWLLGMINWQGWYLPIVSWDAMFAAEHNESAENARIAVIKNLHSQDGMPYFAIISRGFPRLLSVTEDDMHDIEQSASGASVDDAVDDAGQCLLATVQLREQDVDIPALPALGAYISQHL